MRFEVLLQALPGRRGYLLVALFLTVLPAFVLPVGQAEEVEDRLAGLRRALEDVLAL